MKKYFAVFIGSFILIMLILISWVIYCDPFFVYHAPKSDLCYTLDSERIQNQGIAEFFEYDSIITGTSLTENFRTSQFDNLFDAESIKIPFSGATFFETANLVDKGFRSGHDIKYVLRSFDINHIADDKDWIRTDLGENPKYLVSTNVFDQLPYVINKDILLDYCIPMFKNLIIGTEGGHTAFDDYCSWRSRITGAEVVLLDREDFLSPNEFGHLSSDEITKARDNIQQNVVDLAIDHPNTEFIYYISPYNVVFWGEKYESGEITKLFEAEKLALNMMLGIDNIKIYCFSNDLDLTTDLDMYCDDIHYCYKVNDQILDKISQDVDLMTRDNYEDYLQEQYDVYMNYDYEMLIE